MIHKTFIVLFVTVCALRQGQAILEAPLETVKQWNLLNFDFPWDWPTNNKDLFNPEQIVTTGMEVGINRIFMATPRLFSGVPATITTMSRSTLGDSPVLQVNKLYSLLRALTYFKNFTGISRLVTSCCWIEAVQLQ